MFLVPYWLMLTQKRNTTHPLTQTHPFARLLALPPCPAPSPLPSRTSLLCSGGASSNTPWLLPCHLWAVDTCGVIYIYSGDLIWECPGRERFPPSRGSEGRRERASVASGKRCQKAIEGAGFANMKVAGQHICGRKKREWKMQKLGNIFWWIRNSVLARMVKRLR